MKKNKILLSIFLSLAILTTSTSNAFATEVTSNSTENSTQSTVDENVTATTNADNENWPVAPDISAGSAILIDADTNTILYEKNCHIKAYPASITKLMTALLAVENCSLNETVTFSHNAAHSITWMDSQIPIVEGEQYTMEQALYALLLKSANEVAYGIGEHVAGDIPSFAQMMTTRAAELGALNTHFNNASGLNDPEHYTTAYDIAMIARACMNNSTIMEIMKTRQYVIPPSNKYGYERTINQSHLMLQKNSEFYYEPALGGKTGFTDESKYTLCTFASQDDMNLIAVVLLCEEKEDRFRDTKDLFEYGFNNFQKLTLNASDTSSLLGKTDYYNSTVFGGIEVNFSLASSSVTVPVNVTGEQINMLIDRSSSTGDAFAGVRFEYAGNVVGQSEITISTTTKAESISRPSNLPYLPEVEKVEIEPKEYIVINATHIIYGVITFIFLTIILLGLLFMNYSEYGKEVMKTRKRRRSYRRRKLKF